MRVLVATTANAGHFGPLAPFALACVAAGHEVGHGGFGTTLSGLRAGVPMVVVPLFALDQYLTARAVERVGAGLCLDGGPSAIAGLGDALVRILDDPSYRAGARRIAAEMASLPEASAGVALLEDLAQT